MLVVKLLLMISMTIQLFSTYITQHKNHFYTIISKSERPAEKRYCA